MIIIMKCGSVKLYVIVGGGGVQQPALCGPSSHGPGPSHVGTVVVHPGLPIG